MTDEAAHLRREKRESRFFALKCDNKRGGRGLAPVEKIVNEDKRVPTSWTGYCHDPLGAHRMLSNTSESDSRELSHSLRTTVCSSLVDHCN